MSDYVPYGFWQQPAYILAKEYPIGAGNKGDPTGYIRIRRGKKQHYLHRLIWEELVGPIPAGMQIDHIDGNKLNNSIENLRVVSPEVNCKNKVKLSRNQTGTTGVQLRAGRYWRATWTSQKGVQHEKSFSINKYGFDQAKKLAEEYRNLMLHSLKDYTDRHGK